MLYFYKGQHYESPKIINTFIIFGVTTDNNALNFCVASFTPVFAAVTRSAQGLNDGNLKAAAASLQPSLHGISTARLTDAIAQKQEWKHRPTRKYD